MYVCVPVRSGEGVGREGWQERGGGGGQWGKGMGSRDGEQLREGAGHMHLGRPKASRLRANALHMP